MAELMVAGGSDAVEGVATLKLNNCGIVDKGIKELVLRGVLRSSTLCTLELSDNYIGPTGANWLASMNREFAFDTLDIGGSFHRSAPFYKYGDAKHDANLDDSNDDPNVFNADYENDYDGYDSGSNAYEPFEDTDMFEGDEYYQDDDDYDNGRDEGRDDDDGESAASEAAAGDGFDDEGDHGGDIGEEDDNSEDEDEQSPPHGDDDNRAAAYSSYQSRIDML
jgi:hypothetical protein